MYEFLTIVLLMLTLETKKRCWLFWINFFGYIFGAKYFKIQPFSSKIAQKKLPYSHLINFAVSKYPKIINTIVLNYKKSNSYFHFAWEYSGIHILLFFANFALWLSKTQLLFFYLLTNKLSRYFTIRKIKCS